MYHRVSVSLYRTPAKNSIVNPLKYGIIQCVKNLSMNTNLTRGDFMNYEEIRFNILKDYQSLPRPIITKYIRSTVQKYKKNIQLLSLDEALVLAELFLKERNRLFTIVAYQILDYKHKDFTIESFFDLERLVYTYIEDWWDCDDFMTHAFRRYITLYPSMLPKTIEWTTHKNFAVRRCAAVILVVPARKGLVDITDVFHVCDILQHDPHYLVQKGYGWLLKEASKHYVQEVLEYLETHHQTMPRTAFRYALEKLPKHEKERLMSLRR